MASTDHDGCGETGTPMIRRFDTADATGISQLERDPLYERVYRELGRMLMEGTFAPGFDLNVRSLAEEFGTSEMPVRDAVRRLVSDGALVSRPNRSPTVRRLSRDEFGAVRDVRVLIEGGATALACASITQEALSGVRQLQRELQHAELKDLALHLNLNRRFHFAIYDACANPLLLSIIEKLWLQIGPLFRSLSIPLIRRDLPDYHRLAVQALGDRDASAAAEAIRNDISSAAAVILARTDVFPPV